MRFALAGARLLAAHRPPVRRGLRDGRMSDPAAADKRAAAERAVAAEVRSGMAVGLGTGSTASPAVEAIGRLLAERRAARRARRADVGGHRRRSPGAPACR